MPPLKNIQHERFAQKVVDNHGNKTQAYIDTYKAGYPTANCNSARVMSRPEVSQRVKEILESTEGTALNNVLRSLNDDLESKRPLVTKGGEIIYVRDNCNILETKKLLLKMHDALVPSVAYSDQRQVNISVLNAPDKVGNIIERLEKMNKLIHNDHDIQDGEIIQEGAEDNEPMPVLTS